MKDLRLATVAVVLSLVSRQHLWNRFRAGLTASVSGDMIYRSFATSVSVICLDK